MSNAVVIASLTVALSSASSSPVAHAATTQVLATALQDVNVDASVVGMVIKTDTARVKAGRVTLATVNQSKNLVHEVLVIPALPDGKDLPYGAKRDMAEEKRVHSLGEISDLTPGARAKLTESRPGHVPAVQ